MPQDQSPIQVYYLDGAVTPGIRVGNNATWLCRCGYEHPLLGKAWAVQGATEKTRVECPGCQTSFFVVPDGADQAAVVEVQEIQWP